MINSVLIDFVISVDIDIPAEVLPGGKKSEPPAGTVSSARPCRAYHLKTDNRGCSHRRGDQGGGAVSEGASEKQKRIERGSIPGVTPKKKPRLVAGAISLNLLVVMGRIELPTCGL
jgi:hypothetical protein